MCDHKDTATSTSNTFQEIGYLATKKATFSACSLSHRKKKPFCSEKVQDAFESRNPLSGTYLRVSVTRSDQ